MSVDQVGIKMFTPLTPDSLIQCFDSLMSTKNSFCLFLCTEERISVLLYKINPTWTRNLGRIGLRFGHGNYPLVDRTRSFNFCLSFYLYFSFSHILIYFVFLLFQDRRYISIKFNLPLKSRYMYFLFKSLYSPFVFKSYKNKNKHLYILPLIMSTNILIHSIVLSWLMYYFYIIN